MVVQVTVHGGGDSPSWCWCLCPLYKKLLHILSGQETVLEPAREEDITFKAHPKILFLLVGPYVPKVI